MCSERTAMTPPASDTDGSADALPCCHSCWLDGESSVGSPLALCIIAATVGSLLQVSIVFDTLSAAKTAP